MIGFWTRLTAVAGLAYLLVSALGGWILTHPPRAGSQTLPRAPLGPEIEVRDVTILPIDPAGPRLKVWFAPAREPDAGAVVFLHGYRGRRTEHLALARELSQASA